MTQHPSRSNPKPYLLLAGQGGGSWGCFPTGALAEYFAHESQAYDGGFGVSVSALIVSRLMASVDGRIPDLAAQRENAKRLENIFLGLTGNESIYHPWKKTKPVSWLLAPLLALLPVPSEVKDVLNALIEGKPSVYDTDPLQKMVQAELAGMKWHPSVRVGLVPLNTGEFKEVPLHENPDWSSAIVASTAIPIAFPPIMGAVDGGVTDVTPLKGVFTCFREHRHAHPGEPQELHVYRCSPLPSDVDTGKTYENLPAVAWRMLNIMTNNTDAEDNSSAVFYNTLSDLIELVWASGDEKLKAKFAAWHEKYGKVAIYVISPSAEDVAEMPAGARVFDPVKIRTGMDRGRARMQDFLANKEKYRLENLIK